MILLIFNWLYVLESKIKSAGGAQATKALLILLFNLSTKFIKDLSFYFQELDIFGLENRLFAIKFSFQIKHLQFLMPFLFLLIVDRSGCV